MTEREPQLGSSTRSRKTKEASARLNVSKRDKQAETVESAQNNTPGATEQLGPGATEQQQHTPGFKEDLLLALTSLVTWAHHHGSYCHQEPRPLKKSIAVWNCESGHSHHLAIPLHGSFCISTEEATSSRDPSKETQPVGLVHVSSTRQSGGQVQKDGENEKRIKQGISVTVTRKRNCDRSRQQRDDIPNSINCDRSNSGSVVSSKTQEQTLTNSIGRRKVEMVKTLQVEEMEVGQTKSDGCKMKGWQDEGEECQRSELREKYVTRNGERGKAGSNGRVRKGSEEQSRAGGEDQSNTGSEKCSRTGSEEQGRTGSKEQGRTGSEEWRRTGSEEQSRAVSEEKGRAENEDQIEKGNKEHGGLGSEEHCGAVSEERGETGSLDKERKVKSEDDSIGDKANNQSCAQTKNEEVLLSCGYDGCNRTFRRDKALEHHLRRHSTPRALLCPFPGCGKLFRATRHLRQHEIVHSDARNFICEACGTSFKNKRNLNVHLRIHTGEKPLQCSLCGFRCRQKASLNWHMRKHDLPPPVSYFMCEVCGRTFERRESLRSHSTIVHPERGSAPHQLGLTPYSIETPSQLSRAPGQKSWTPD
uniref:E3 ubiquitin-protein ligase ZFP91-like isoform X2 n=1 Tax=Myxine glutinosa TaxID=7769 RepID=UPI00358F3E47